MPRTGPGPVSDHPSSPRRPRARVRAIGALGLAFLFVNGYWVVLGGLVRSGGDTERYQIAGAALLQGKPLAQETSLYVRKATSYLAYDAVVSLALATGAGMAGVVMVQFVFAALAALAQYDLGRQLGGPWAGLIAAGLLVANPDITRWHTYILTESLFTSTVIVTVWAVHRVRVRPGLASFAVMALAVAFTVFLRPNGWIVALACLLHLQGQTLRRWSLVFGVAGTISLFVLGAVFVPAFREGVQAEAPEDLLRKGEVIWGHPPSRITMPRDEHPAEPGWTHALGYVVRHPLACARLAGLRVFTEFAHVRPFYSNVHNALVVAFLAPTYVLAAIGFRRSHDQPLAHLLALVIAGQTLVIGLTFADWDGRFLLYVLPQVIVLASAGVVAILKRRSFGRFVKEDAPAG